jgi:hypothetical protein
MLCATVFPLGVQLKRTLIFLHRWMGVVLCLLFFLWFSSGIAMIYWEYPLVSPDDRLARSEPLDPSKVHLSPAEAYARLATDLPPPVQARLTVFDSRPAYKFGSGADQVIVYADDGQLQTEFQPELTRRIAAAWTAQSGARATEEENAPLDQWTVYEGFAALRPLRKYTWPNGDRVYVSTQNGEVAQFTTRASRLGAYLGPIPHWLYFTPLRKNGQRWTSLVIWASGFATALAIIGIAVGVSIYSPARRYRYRDAPSALPYVGWKRWHSILGLVFGVFACTWTFSGMLSMDPFPVWQGEQRNMIRSRFDRAARGDGINLAAFASKPPQQALADAGAGIKQLELASVFGNPAYLASTSPNETRIVPVHGQPFSKFDTHEIVSALANAASPYSVSQVRTVTEYESYYLDRRHRLPLPVLYAQLDDPQRSGFYIDPSTARIVQSYNSRSRRNRWLYHGLHSIDLPLLYAHRPAWDILVLALMLGGASLSFTSVLLSWAVLCRKLHRGGKQSAGAPKTAPAAP